METASFQSSIQFIHTLIRLGTWAKVSGSAAKVLIAIGHGSDGTIGPRRLHVESLCAAVGLSKTTVYDTLYELEPLGVVRRDGSAWVAHLWPPEAAGHPKSFGVSATTETDTKIPAERKTTFVTADPSSEVESQGVPFGKAKKKVAVIAPSRAPHEGQPHEVMTEPTVEDVYQVVLRIEKALVSQQTIPSFPIDASKPPICFSEKHTDVTLKNRTIGLNAKGFAVLKFLYEYSPCYVPPKDWIHCVGWNKPKRPHDIIKYLVSRGFGEYIDAHQCIGTRLINPTITPLP